MLTAVIADIHGNLSGLLPVLDDIAACKCDRIVCLGDIVDGGPENAGTLEKLRSYPAGYFASVRGNHDEYPSGVSREGGEFLRGLPESLIENDVIYTHISPRKKANYIATPIDAWMVFDDTPWRLIFVGHYHAPAIFGAKCSTPVSATRYPIEYGHALTLDIRDRYIVRVGAIGYSRDMTDRPVYCLYDDSQGTIEMRIVEGPLLDLAFRLP